jgi:hypothetical protein
MIPSTPVKPVEVEATPIDCWVMVSPLPRVTVSVYSVPLKKRRYFSTYDTVVCHTREGTRTVADRHRLASVDAGASLYVRGGGTNPCVRASSVDNQVVCNNT